MALEELDTRTDAHNELMVLAAQTSRRWWEVAGDATHVLLADVRVASSWLAVDQPSEALPFARAAAEASGREGTLAGYRIQAMLVLGHASLGTADPQGAAQALQEAEASFANLPEDYHGYYAPQIETLRAACAVA